MNASFYIFDIEGCEEYIRKSELKLTEKIDELMATAIETTEIITVELTPIKIESLSIMQNPYTVKYQTGSTFNAEGLILSAIYNDGSTKVIPADKYEVDTQKQLTTADSSISVRKLSLSIRYAV